MGGGDKTEKTTIMVLKVDLQCPSCYKKAKKVLCKIPQVRDQVYDEKGNTIAITVVCCSPEKVRDKLCYKGGKAIKSIEIKAPENQKQPEKPKGSDKPKVVTFETPKEKPKEPKKPKGPEKPTVIDKPKPKESEKPKEANKAALVATPWAAEPVVMMPLPVQGYPHGCGCGQCYHTGGPCYQYYGTPVPPGPYYGSYPYGYGPGPGPGYYFNDENAQGCTIM